MEDKACGVIPNRTSSIDRAKEELAKRGCVVFQHIGPQDSATRDFALRLFEDRTIAVPEGARVLEGGEAERERLDLSNLAGQPVHTDGFAYGDLYPDFILLGCVRSSEQGGESVLVDGYQLLENMDSSSENSELAERLRSVAIDMTEEGMQESHSPLVIETKSGRLMLRRTLEQKPCDNSSDAKGDQEMIDLWIGAIDEAAKEAPRFKLEPGEVLVVDNYRMFHGRDPYTDADRMLWRVWVWTRDALGVPELELASDSRYAGLVGQ